ncbi:MAG: phosphoglycerate kinase [Phycisphaerales bacterium]|nr:phosphoglycerate kinase [Phycisphaerales bacterium]
MRVDFNVPLDAGRITDDRRIVMALESIRSVIDRGGRLVLMSHLGRPKGEPRPEFSLRPVAEHLETLLERPVAFAEDCIGGVADAKVIDMKDGDVLLLENVRFHKGEDLIDKVKKSGATEPTPQQRDSIDGLTELLAKHGEVYCNNAFGTCHREHVSMYNVPLAIRPGPCVVGHLVEKELRFLGGALANPSRPFVAILGGAKVSDKIGVIENLLPKVDSILIGGAMAYTFLASQGNDIGKSLCERDRLDLAKSLLQKANGKIRLPSDSICAAELAEGVNTKTCDSTIPADLMGLDIGPKTIADYAAVLANAKTIIWNGPMGVFETPPFDKGTLAVANALAKATQLGATTIIGGGDSAAAVEAAGLASKMTHISTGGGASLEFLEGRPFETLEILDDA